MNKQQRRELRKVFDRARAKAGGSILELARELGLPRTTVASWFSGCGSVSLANWLLLLEWLDEGDPFGKKEVATDDEAFSCDDDED